MFGIAKRIAAGKETGIQIVTRKTEIETKQQKADISSMVNVIEIAFCCHTVTQSDELKGLRNSSANERNKP